VAHDRCLQRLRSGLSGAGGAGPVCRCRREPVGPNLRTAPVLETRKPHRSLAPGADITFARSALAEQVPLKVLLPCDKDTFRAKKVKSRGEPWTSHYDRTITTSHVTIDDRANLDPDDDADRRRHNVAMLDNAAQSAGADGKRVWVITIRPRSTPSASSVTDDLVLRSEEWGILSIDLDPSPKDHRGPLW
jgi:hypothetical protein